MGIWDQLRQRMEFGPARSAPNPLARGDWHFVDDAEWVGRLGEDPKALLVYADWLEERGDHRAELVRRALSGSDFEAFVEANARALLGPLSDRRRHEKHSRAELELGWRGGVLVSAGVRTLRLSPEEPGEPSVWSDTEALLQLPVARHLEALSLGIDDPNAILMSDERLAMLGRPESPRLRRLHLGDFEYPDECEMSWAQLGNLSTLWRHLPRVEELTLRGLVSDLGGIDAPALTRFSRETSGLTTLELSQIVAARWPRLEHLEVWFGATEYGATCTLADVEPLLERLTLSVRSLGLKNCEFADELAGAVVRSPALPQLERLDLSLGCVTEAGARTLLQHSERLVHLVSLDLSSNLLPPEQVERLRALCPRVELADQRPVSPGQGRYVSVSE